MTKPVLPILFRVDRSDKGVFAVFPTLPGTNARDTCTLYAHVGQHHSGSDAYIVELSRPAKPDEYVPLLRELTQIYDDCALKIVSRITHKMQRERYAALEKHQ